MTALADEQQMEQLQQGNAVALHELYRRHAREQSPCLPQCRQCVGCDTRGLRCSWTCDTVQGDWVLPFGNWLRNPRQIAEQSITALIGQQRDCQQDLYTAHPGAVIHPLSSRAGRHLAFDDSGHASELVADGRRAAEGHLAVHGASQRRASEHVSSDRTGIIDCETGEPVRLRRLE